MVDIVSMDVSIDCTQNLSGEENILTHIYIFFNADNLRLRKMLSLSHTLQQLLKTFLNFALTTKSPALSHFNTNVC